MGTYVNMYVYVCVCLCICMTANVYVCKYISVVYMCMSVCMCMRRYARLYECMEV